MATHSSILAWKNLMDRVAWQATVHGVAKELDTTTKQQHHFQKFPLVPPLFFFFFVIETLNMSLIILTC